MNSSSYIKFQIPCYFHSQATFLIASIVLDNTKRPDKFINYNQTTMKGESSHGKVETTEPGAMVTTPRLQWFLNGPFNADKTIQQYSVVKSQKSTTCEIQPEKCFGFHLYKLMRVFGPVYSHHTSLLWVVFWGPQLPMTQLFLSFVYICLPHD